MPARRLYRSRKDQIIGGVCAGIADHFDVDPVLVRLGAAGITFLGFPFAIVGYIACWVIIPEEPRLVTGSPSPGVPPRAEPVQQMDAAPVGAPDDQSALTGQETATVPPPPQSSAAPPEAAYEPEDRARPGNTGMAGGCVLVLIGLFFLMINLDFFHWHDLRFWRWPFFLPAILIGFGVWLLVRAVLPGGSDRNG